MTDRLRACDWVVASCSLDQARELVERYHYAGSCSNTAVATHGLYRRGSFVPVGATWWLPPVNVGKWWHTSAEVLNLSRLVLAPDVPKNAATFLLMRSVRQLPLEWRCLLTYADTWQGHTGHIYRAAGWEYLGLTEPERVYTLGGRMVSRKVGPRTRTHTEMLSLGAVCEGSFPKHRYRYVRAMRARRAQPQQLELLGVAA